MIPPDRYSTELEDVLFPEAAIPRLIVRWPWGKLDPFTGLRVETDEAFRRRIAKLKARVQFRADLDYRADELRAGVRPPEIPRWMWWTARAIARILGRTW